MYYIKWIDNEGNEQSEVVGYFDKVVITEELDTYKIDYSVEIISKLNSLVSI